MNKKEAKVLNESELIKERYSKREQNEEFRKYSIFNPEVMYAVIEKERAIINIFKSCGLIPVENKRLLEIGCGNGINLLNMIRLGFNPKNLKGNELLPDRIKAAKSILSPSVEIYEGDALELDFERESFDIVYQSVVFTSILNDNFQEKLAEKMWSWVKTGGGVLWYDFIYNNPSNPDVRGVTIDRVKKLFPDGEIVCKKITLAPPISRRVTKLHPSLYSFFNMFPFLRTHVLCWIGKK